VKYTFPSSEHEMAVDLKYLLSQYKKLKSIANAGRYNHRIVVTAHRAPGLPAISLVYV
jgi:hypothetical protein